MDASLILQSALRYLHASWPVDDLIKLYLTGSVPGEYRIAPAEVWLEVRGARDEFDINRLDRAEFGFRKAILEGQPIGAAAGCALDTDARFDIARAFATLITSGRVIGAIPPGGGKR